MIIRTEDYKQWLPDELLTQIEHLCEIVKKIQQETGIIISQNSKSGASIQLHDVLQTTEKATLTILDAATGILSAADEYDILKEGKEKISGHVTQIYEACNFQDISGQRIKKVLSGMQLLETNILRLADIAKAHIPASESADTGNATETGLMNGPQLADEAPSQDDIDKLFGSAN